MFEPHLARSAVPAAHCYWDSGHLRVRSNGGREQVLPTPADVGVAIAAAYLQDGHK
jgi:hypothetical protein